jgi:hypothetical protein
MGPPPPGNQPEASHKENGSQWDGANRDTSRQPEQFFVIPFSFAKIHLDNALASAESDRTGASRALIGS